MRGTRPLVVVAAALMLAVPATVAAQDEMVDVSGTEFTIFGAPTGVESDAIDGFLGVYNAENGTNISFAGSDDFESQLRIRVEGGDPPEMVFTPQPGTICEMADEGHLASLEDMGFDIAEMEANHSAYLVGLGECADGKHYGVPWFTNYKSIIFYHKPTFEAQGYLIPETWEELISLSTQAVNDGFTPWCQGFGSGPDTGWPGTDWIEDIVLRQAGVDVYEQWYKHEIPFNDPRIVTAFDTFGELLFGEGFTLGGAENIDGVDFRDMPGPIFNDDPGPGCLMFKQGSFISNFFETQPQYEDGESAEIDVFAFPDIDGNSGALGGADTILVFNDSPENIQIVKDWITPDWLCTLASSTGGGVAPYGGHGVAGVERLPGHKDTDPQCMDSENAKVFAAAVTSALDANGLAFDGGDLMPSAVGQGTFWTGMVDFAQGKSAQDVADEVEATWPEE